MNGQQDPRQGYPANAGAPYGAPPPPNVQPTWTRNIADLGVDPRLAGDPRRKSPGLAAILSSMPGLGQIYIGYYLQGFIHIAVVGVIIVLLSGYGYAVRHFEPLLGLFLAFFWLYNIVDAYRRAAFYNQALAGLGAVEIPEDMKLPKGSGSMAGGIALIAIGGLLFANTALGISLDWLEQWWPMGLVLLGAYLVYASAAAKRTAAAPRARMEDPAERA